MQRTSDLLIFVPTYNERENVPVLLEQLEALKLGADILFMDDNSPDGTGELLVELQKSRPHLRLIRRTGKLGIGSAHYEGIHWAYQQGYTKLITMDCDFTHPPEYIPALIKAGEDHDIAVGSRYLQKKSLSEWNLYRKFLTTMGHLLTTKLLGMPYDATGAFRYYRLDRVPSHAFDLVGSRGYSFFFESLYIMFRNGLKIAEIPIHLPARTYGHSKMDRSEIGKSVKFLFKIYVTNLLNSEKFMIVDPVTYGSLAEDKQDKQGWDDYWKNQKKASGLLYDTIAAFYRKFIIKRILGHFVRLYFKPGAKVLHAGCGSGQVDTEIRDYVKITGLDISLNALNFYRRTNQKNEILHGSIFEIPLPDASVDGIYNLGVMEHFTPEEIHVILGEFKRVLKPGGRAILFWPPEFGASVVFFKILKFIFANFLGKKDIKFHPDEITRVRSKKHVRELVEAADLKMIRYYFGMKDFLTYSVIVCEKEEGLTIGAPSSKGKLEQKRENSTRQSPQPLTRSGEQSAMAMRESNADRLA